MVVAAACLGLPHHLPAVIDAVCVTHEPPKCTQVSHRPVTVEESVVSRCLCRLPHHLPAGIYAVCLTS